MRRKNEQETFEILHNAFLSLEKMGVYSLYTRQYLDSMRAMISLQQALSIANHKGCGCSSHGILEIEDLEAVLSKVTFDTKHFLKE